MGNQPQQKPNTLQRRKHQPETSNLEDANGAAASPGLTLSPSTIFRLQHTIGNQAVQRLLAHGKQTGTKPAIGAISARPATAIQRYSAREHVKFGEVDSMITPQEKMHTIKPLKPMFHAVKDNESASAIASQYGVVEDFLIARNAVRYRVTDTKTGPKPLGFKKDDNLVLPGKTVAEVASDTGIDEATIVSRNSNLVQTWTAPISNKEFTGFDRGRTIILSTGKLEVAPGAVAAQATGQKTIKIKGVTFTYGQVIALGGDLYGSPEAMYKAPKSELEALKDLLEKEAKDPKLVGDKDWERVTGGRYLRLASVNSTHYGPHDPALTPPKKSSSNRDHKSEWEKYHEEALNKAQTGDRDGALGINAFADHFLTDAFASGHLFNKEDVMNRFEEKFDPKTQEAFFKHVAYSSWSKVGKYLDKYETADTIAGKHWNISFPEYFQTLLQDIYKDKDGKREVLNLIVLMCHNDLNKNGVDVENQKGDKWHLTGDGKLNDRSLSIGRQAVAQSQVNILNNVGKTDTLDFPALFKSVWDFVPRPTKSGAKVIDQVITQYTDPSNPKTLSKAIEIVIDKIEMIVQGLIERKKLKKA